MMKYLLAVLVFVFMASPAMADNVVIKRGSSVVIRDRGDNAAANIARGYLNRNNSHVYFYNGDEGVRQYYNYNRSNPNSPAAEISNVCGNVKARKYNNCVKDYMEEREKIVRKYRD